MSNKGVTLAELLIGIGIGSMVAVMAATVVQTSSSSFYSFLNRLETEEAVHNAAVTLQSHLSMAVDLRIGAPAAMGTFSNNVGRILPAYDLSTWTASTGNGEVDVIAFFLRENLPSGWNYTNPAPSGANRYPVTAIFFQKPTVDKYGMLYIKSDSSNSASVTAGKADIRIPNVVDFQILDVFTTKFYSPKTRIITATGADFDGDLNDEQMVSSVTFKVTVRNYFGVEQGVHKWCPPQFISNYTECATKGAFKDTEKVFVVKIRNNTTGTGVVQRIAPPAGVDNLIDTPAYQRSVDTVYFLKPVIPVGQVKR